MERYIVDRFEGDFAVLESEEGGTVDILKSLLPDANEGDVILFENELYRVDKEETLKRQELIAEKMRKLFEKN